MHQSRGDDDDRSCPRAKRPRGRIALIVFGLTLIAVLAVCVGNVAPWALQRKRIFDNHKTESNFYGFRMGFYESLSGGRVNDAYALTTSDFRGRCSREQFQLLINSHPVLTAPHTVLEYKPPYRPTRGRVAFSDALVASGVDVTLDEFTSPFLPARFKRPEMEGKVILCRLVLAEQPDGKWWVDEFTIP